MNKIILYLLVFIAFPGLAAGNPLAVPLRLNDNPADLRVDHLMEKDGLSSQITYYILKDRYGFIWIATNNGLDRYDGSTVKTFRNNGRGVGSLPRADINSLYEDGSGRLWVATGEGLVLYNRSNESFTLLNVTSGEEHAADNMVYAVHEDNAQVLWLFTAGGLHAYDPSEGLFTPYRECEIGLGYAEEYRILNIDYNTNRRFCEDKEGNIWIGTTSNGLFRINREGTRVDHYLHDPDVPGSISDNLIRDVKTDQEGTVWIISGQSFLERLVDPAGGYFERYTASAVSKVVPDNLTAIHIGRQNAVWVFSQQGITKINRRCGESVVQHQHRPVPVQ
jgi:ligand-binding sensor domain-containing protein